jgi:glycosyltransferase involved in cell wall biosynthesis
MPLVSIVLPLYNGAQYIEATLASIGAQTHRDAELIVVNDGSTDASPEMVARSRESAAMPVLQTARIVTQDNQGVAAARNRGIAEARGAWIALIDQDDLWHPDKLAQQLAALAARPAARWCYSAFVRFYDSGREVPKDDGADDRTETWRRLLGGQLFIPPAAALVAREVCAAVAGFDSAFVPSDDWDFFLKLAEEYECCYCAARLTRFRSHRGSTGKRQQRRIFEAQREVLARHAPRSEGIVAPRVIRRREANILWHLGREEAAAGEEAAARQHFFEALRRDPRRVKLLRAWLMSHIRT